MGNYIQYPLINHNGTSLVIQWLGLHASNTGTMVEETVMISIHPNMNPSVYYKSRSSSGNEYALHANYPKANQPFVETSNTFPKYFEPQESLTLNMTLMDILMQRVVNMSFADFGLYYVKS